MNRPLTFLDVEMQLLLLRHGRSAVMEALSRELRMELPELENAIREIARRNSQKSTRKGEGDRYVRLLNATPAPKRPTILSILARFENKQFLPTANAIAGFLEAHSHRVRHIKSRRDALLVLIKVLQELPEADLERIARIAGGSASDSGSDYLSFAQHLAGPPPTQ